MEEGPDRGYSWVIVACCAYIHFALLGLLRSAGVMYVAILEHYDVTREEASWPFSLLSASFQLIGPAASILTFYVSQRKACMLGSAIATIGVTCCFLAESILWINICFGVVFGIGFGLIFTIVPVILTQYFVKHRATAIGFAFAGGSLSSLIFPIAMEWLLTTYDLRGSFLILGGLVMNTLVATSLLRAPPWLDKKKTPNPEVLEDSTDGKDSGVSTSGDIVALNDVKANGSSLPRSESELSVDHVTSQREVRENTPLTNEETTDEAARVDLSGSSLDDTDRNQITAMSNTDSLLFDELHNSSYESSAPASDAEHIDIEIKDSENTRYDASNDFASHDKSTTDYEIRFPLMDKHDATVTPDKTSLKSRRRFKCTFYGPLTDVLRQPMFHLITFTFIIYFMGLHSFFLVIVDFAKDKGIPESKGIYIISMFSLTDVFGRACLGWITDRNYITRKNMITLNLGVIGILCQFYSIATSFSGMLVISAIHGLMVGCSITLFFVLQAEYLGLKQLTLAVGLTNFINGSVNFLRPAMIGMFRDVIGSYNWMFHFIGVTTLVFAVIWIAESRFAERRMKHEANK